MPNPFDTIRKFFKGPVSVPADTVVSRTFSDQEKELIRKFGVHFTDLQDLINKSTAINFERTNIYKELDKAILYPLIGAAVELYAEVATNFDRLMNRTVWVVSKDQFYVNLITQLFDEIGLEEKIFDWAYTLALYGDLFVKINAVPGLGIVSIDDSEHPSSVSRIDKEGVLIGFYRTPFGLVSEPQKMIPPWEFAHFRLLGVKKKRPLYADPMFSEYRSVTLLSPDVRRLSSKYGTSLLINALPIYKRLRLAEDSLLLSRLSKSIMRYIFKVQVDGTNINAVSEIIEEYKLLLKRTRAVDTTPGAEKFTENLDFMDVLTDLVVPVWGNVNNLTVEQLGGHCLRGDTRIVLLDGTEPAIKEMAENREKYVGKEIYACNKDGRVVVRRIKDVLMSRPNATFLRIHLDNGKYFDCTEDHKCMLRNGQFVEARYLSVGDSLMPFYKRESEKKNILGYEEVYIPETRKWESVHKLVAEQVLREEYENKYKELVKAGKEKYLVVHHRDFNKFNNDSSNLEWMGVQEHWDLHSKLAHGFIKYNKSEKGRARSREVARRIHSVNKGKSFEEIYGVERAHVIKNKLAESSRRNTLLRWSRLTKEERSEWIKRNVVLLRKSFEHKKECNCIFCQCKNKLFKSFEKVDNYICKYCGMEFNNVKKSVLMNHVQWNCPMHTRTVRKPCSLNTKIKNSIHASNRKWIINLNGDTKFVKIEEVDNYLKLGWYLGRKMKFVNSKMDLKSEYTEVLNHKIIKIEKLDVVEDAYDLVIEDAYDRNGGPEHCFALSCGVFVHNSDIRWIVDIEELRNQLAAALRVPLQLLGGYTGEMPSGLGSSAIERLDIRFARSARRIQRALIDGLKRLVQIHLSYRGISADLSMFDILMAETSSAEEEELKNALDKGADIVTKLYDVMDRAFGENAYDKIELLDYLNKKILKLNDLELEKLIRPNKELAEAFKARKAEEQKKVFISEKVSEINRDVDSFTVLKEDEWYSLYGECLVKEERIGGKK